MPSEQEIREAVILMDLNDSESFKIIHDRLKQYAVDRRKTISSSVVTVNTGPALLTQLGREDMLSTIDDLIGAARNTLVRAERDNAEVRKPSGDSNG